MSVCVFFYALNFCLASCLLMSRSHGCRDGTPLTSEEVVAIEQRRAVAQAAQAARIKVGVAYCAGFMGFRVGS